MAVNTILNKNEQEHGMRERKPLEKSSHGSRYDHEPIITHTGKTHTTLKGQGYRGKNPSCSSYQP
jgi:hypothetical protein